MSKLSKKANRLDLLEAIKMKNMEQRFRKSNTGQLYLISKRLKKRKKKSCTIMFYLICLRLAGTRSNIDIGIVLGPNNLAQQESSALTWAIKSKARVLNTLAQRGQSLRKVMTIEAKRDLNWVKFRSKKRTNRVSLCGTTMTLRIAFLSDLIDVNKCKVIWVHI